MILKNMTLENVIVKLIETDIFRATICISNGSIIITPQLLKIPSVIVLIKSLDRYEKVFSLNSNILILYLKSISIIQLEFANLDILLEICTFIENQKILIENNEIYYPELYKSNFTNTSLSELGWDLFLLEEEYKRILDSHSEQWNISNINQKYQICPSYPPLLIVPKNVQEQTISKCSAFRKNRRFPILSFIYSKSGGYILRSSQPLIGPSNNRSKADEDYLTGCLRAGKRGYIVDTRSMSCIQNSRNAGGGTEHESRYPQWKRIYIPIDTQNFQESYKKLAIACLDDGLSDKWISVLEGTNWLTYIHTLLNGARLLADILRTTGSPILIHGNNGCDSSAQLTSLIQIILNPRARTYVGIQALIQREWLWMGHPFRDRCGVGPFSDATTESLLNPLDLSTSQTSEKFQTFLPDPSLVNALPALENFQVASKASPGQSRAITNGTSVPEDGSLNGTCQVGASPSPTIDLSGGSSTSRADSTLPPPSDSAGTLLGSSYPTNPGISPPIVPTFTRQKLSLGVFSTNNAVSSSASTNSGGSEQCFSSNPGGGGGRNAFINRARSNIQSLMGGGGVGTGSLRKLSTGFRTGTQTPATPPKRDILATDKSLSTQTTRSSSATWPLANSSESSANPGINELPPLNLLRGDEELSLVATTLSIASDHNSTGSIDGGNNVRTASYGNNYGSGGRGTNAYPSGNRSSSMMQQSQYQSTRNEATPTFLIFLDCVLQMMHQFPTLFEYNTSFIREIFKHAYASQFGTFLFNNCHEREIYEIALKTVSLWHYINLPEMKQTFTNKFYNAEHSSSDDDYLRLDTNPQNLELSGEFFAIWNVHNPFTTMSKTTENTEQQYAFQMNETNFLESLHASLLEEEKMILSKIKLLQKCF